MYCWASAPSCCLKILVDKQDNASVAINNNLRDVILFVLCNCPTSSLKLILVFEVSLVKLHPKLVIMTSEFNLSHSLL